MDCPDCGREFYKASCSCGYKPAGTTASGKVPVCIRCGADVFGAPVLYTICKECLRIDYERLVKQASQLSTAPFTTKGDRDGQGDRPGADSGPAPGTLSHVKHHVKGVLR